MTRRGGLALAALIYALFSSPTPDAPAWPEYLILALVALAVLPLKTARESWAKPYGLFLAYGLSVPLVIGALAGSASGDMARDWIAFAALALPVFLAPLYPPKDNRAQNQLFIMLLGIGLIFSIRYLMNTFTLSGLFADHDLLYLANSPLVAFAGAWLLLHGTFAERRFALALGWVILSLIPIAAMLGMMQRATLALLALAWCAGFIVTLVRRPQRALVIALCATIIAILAWPLPAYIAASLYDKTLAVGWNARGAEISAIFDAATQNPLTFLFGAGWGALFKSPAVGDLWVRFSHALLTALLWKTGLFGLILGVTALSALIRAAAIRLKDSAVALTALVLPLIPALFLYGSYKSLCFGLLLLGLACLSRTAWTRQTRPL